MDTQELAESLVTVVLQGSQELVATQEFRDLVAKAVIRVLVEYRATQESVVKAAIRELVDILVKAVTQDCQESVDTLESQVFPDIVVCRDILVSRASQVIAEYRDSLVLPDIVELQVYLVTQVFLDIVV